MNLLEALEDAPDEVFVTAAYHTLLGRPPDESGRGHYLDRLHTGDIDRAGLLQALQASGEGQARLERHPRLALFGQRPRQEGDLGLEQLLSIPGDAEFLQLAYLRLLQRDADPDGFSNYAHRLRTGIDRLAILDELSNSSEGRGKAVHLPGLEEAKRVQSWCAIPLVGPLIRAFLRPTEMHSIRAELVGLRASSEAARLRHEEFHWQSVTQLQRLEQQLASLQLRPAEPVVDVLAALEFARSGHGSVAAAATGNAYSVDVSRLSAPGRRLLGTLRERVPVQP